MIMKIINFDMDGTLADFYGVYNWLDDLMHNSTRPYEVAKPLVDVIEISILLQCLRDKGYEINIISWGSKNATDDFLSEIEKAKKEWLAKYFDFDFDNIFVIPYNTPKDTVKKGILFDDDKSVRMGYNGVTFDEKSIIETLYMLLFE